MLNLLRRAGDQDGRQTSDNEQEDDDVSQTRVFFSQSSIRNKRAASLATHWEKHLEQSDELCISERREENDRMKFSSSFVRS